MKSGTDALTLSAPRKVVLRVAKEGALLGWLAICTYLLLAFSSFSAEDPGWSTTGTNDAVENIAGPIGAWLANVFFSLFGYLAYLFPGMIAHRLWCLLRERHRDRSFDMLVLCIRFAGFVLVMAAATALMVMQTGNDSGDLPFSYGGIVGVSIAEAVEGAFGFIGATLLLLVMGLFGLTIVTDLSWFRLMDCIGALTLKLVAAIIASIDYYRHRHAEKRQARVVVQVDQNLLPEQIETAAALLPPIITTPAVKPEIGEPQQQQPQILFQTAADGELPPLSLLDQSNQHLKKGYSEESLAAISRLLELKLEDFSIIAEVVSVLPGPVVTRFEMQPAPGVKVSRITNLAKDLARSLAVISVRVVEIIPGKSVIGIEIPNEQRQIVRLHDVLSSSVYGEADSSLTLALGHNISGDPVVADLAKMPHLLVAGTTGSGKSVGVNVMLLSLLYKSTPREVRLILVDPKMLELSVYEGIPHLLTPVITDMKDAANGLRWCVGEMERRYKLMAALGVRNVAGYNRKVDEAEQCGRPLTDPLFRPEEAFAKEQAAAAAPKLERLPSIVVIIDEFADMMMIVGKKVEQLIARIAQKARAAGIHLILATQRPSVDVITGLIKANIPTRIAFQVSSKVDSRTILDQGGAEQLLGHGDMLYLPPGTSVSMRVHGAFVDDHEVHRVVENWKQRARPNYIDGVVDEEVNTIAVPGLTSTSEEADSTENDALYDEAVAFVIESRKASISSVQRKLRIGYNRAARLIETMEAAGVVSEMGHNGSREVLVPAPSKE